MTEVQRSETAWPGPEPFPWSRVGILLVALHTIAVLLDRLIGLGNSSPYRQEVGLTFLVQMIYCDAALLCVWGMRERSFPAKLVTVCAIPSLTLAALLLWCWVDWSSPAFHFTRLISESFLGQCLILTVMFLPLMISLTWLAVRGGRQDQHWFLLALMLILAVSGCYLSSTAYGYFTTQSRGWWLDRGWICFFHVVLAGALSFAAVMLCAWVLDHWRRGGPYWVAAMVIGASAMLVACTSYLEIVTNQGFYYTWPRLARQQIADTAWQLIYRQGISQLAAIFMLGICALFSLLGVKRISGCRQFENELVESPFAKAHLDEEARRYRLWKLAGFALGISALNLFAGMYAWLTRIDRSAFGNLGLLFELLFLAPLGLWSAQLAASAIFLECKIWNFWKRLLIVLAWAELTILAYWGQVALSNSIQWYPSDYVGEVLHVAVGAVALASVGKLFALGSGVRITWKQMEGSSTIKDPKRRLSISLSDIICIVTVSAGLAYPFSVIFSLENWVTPSSLFREMVYSSVWPLVTGAAGYFALRAWLKPGNQALAFAAASALCLMSSCATDYPSLTQVGDETFFGVRYSLRMMALPWLFVGTAIAGIGLRRVGFGFAPIPTSVEMKRGSVVGGILATDKGLAPIGVKEATPWD